MKRNFVLILVFIGLFTTAQTPNALFEQANIAYKNKKYQVAADLYTKALASGKQSGDVFFNLANAYYKLNKIAPAIYNYERAKLMNPADEDINQNLRLANQMKMDKITPVPENILLRLKKKMTHLFSYNTWAYLTIFWAFIGMLVFGIFLFIKKTNIKRIAFAGMFISLFLLLFSWYNANYARTLSREKYAIIFSPKTDLLNEPNRSADNIVTLHEGTKVQVLRAEDGWKQVKLPNGKKGWLPNDTFVIIE